MAFLADRAARVLHVTHAISLADQKVLRDARELLDSALTGDRLITKKEYSVAAAKNFADLTWTTTALSAMVDDRNATEMPGVAEVLQQLMSTIDIVLEGATPHDEQLDASRKFFEGLREVVLSTRRRSTDVVEYVG